MDMEASARSGAPWSVHVLGRFELRIDERTLADGELGSRKERQLLKLLLLERGRWVAVGRIVELLWDDPPARAERQVATLVSRLRAALGRGRIEGGPETYRVRPPEGSTVDLDDAEQLTTEAERRLASEEPVLAASAAERALALLERGAPLEDEPYAVWVQPTREEAAHLLRRARAVAWRAALTTGDPPAAVSAAERAIAADPLDEGAHRALMVAYAKDGAVPAVRATFERLRVLLDEELGVAPSPETEALRRALETRRPERAVLEPEDPGTVPAREAREAVDPTFVGRVEEQDAFARSWSAAVAGRSGLMLLVGEAGIGKSTLARRGSSLARSTGGLVLEARCYAAERSLFLQPIADALRPFVLRSTPAALRGLIGDAAADLVRIAPELVATLGVREPPPTVPELEHRRTFDAAVRLFRAIAERQGVLLFLDDLHDAGAATAEFLHYLVRSASRARLLVLGTLRVEEGDAIRHLLAEVAEERVVGPLRPADVRRLAVAMGAPAADEALLERAQGHPLFVVEMLRALVEKAGEGATSSSPPIPVSLRAAVLGRSERAGPGVRDLLSAAAVVGARFDLASVAALAEVSVEGAIQTITQAHRARLVSVIEADYAFANDLIREILYEATPRPIRVARHRAAARLASERPEVVARHAHAAGDWTTAATAWRAAAGVASAAFANRDAERLLDRALEAARRSSDAVMEGEVLLDRGRVLERLARYPASFDDHAAAREVARRVGARSLEMRALREMGGDPSLALGRPIAASVPYLESALALADALGEHGAAVDILRRLAILETNRLQAERARRFADAAVERARGSDDDATLAAALDGRKTVMAYVGQVATLANVVSELEPVLERLGDLWLLQWTVFESSLVPFAAGRWAAADAVIDRALGLSRRSGYLAYQPMFLAQRAWILSASGALGTALEVARHASDLAIAADHPWWIAFADAVLGNVLLSVGATDEAVAVLERGLSAADTNGADLYALRLLGPLAEAAALLGDDATAAAAARRVEELVLDEKRGPVYLHAAHGPLGAARAWVSLGAPHRAAPLLRRVAAAAEAEGWVEPRALAALGEGAVAAATGRYLEAARALRRCLGPARRAPLPAVAADAHAAWAAVHRAAGATGGARRAASAQRHALLAAQLYAKLRVSLPDTAMRRAYDARTARHLSRSFRRD
jgi:DNA-binding SARP family transcriptional activator/tetratricopeptide (TPR) repeat protein